MRKFLVLFSLVGVAALSTVAASQAAVVSHTSVPFASSILNTCNGDTVSFTGTFDQTTRITTAGSGRVNEGFDIRIDGAGVGSATGASYIVHVTIHATSNNVPLNADGAAVTTDTATFNAIGQGNVPNISIHSVFHETVTPDGTVTADFFLDNVTCA